MKKVAVCQLNGRVAPRYDFAGELAVFTIDGGRTIVDKQVIPVHNMSSADLADLLNRLGVDLLICGGAKGESQLQLRRHHIRFIDNVIGSVDDALALHLAGVLRRGHVIN